MPQHVILRFGFIVYSLYWLIGCAEETKEVPDPIDASLETEDLELRQFVGDMYTKAVENPTSALHRGRLGLVYDANGFTEVAAITYGQARTLDTGDMRWPYLEGLALARQGRIEEAAHVMDLAIELDNSYIPSYLAKGFWLLDLGEYVRACDTFEFANSLDDAVREEVPIALGIAQCKLELGEIDAALDVLGAISVEGLPPFAAQVRDRVERAAGISRERADLTIDSTSQHQGMWSDPIAGAVVEYTRGLSGESLLAQRLIEGERADDALQLIESLQERYPDERNLVELRSAALTILGRRGEAVAVLQEGLTSFPDSYVIRFNLGLLLESVGQPETALHHFEEAIRRKNDFLPAYDAKATLLIQQNRSDLARKALEESLAFRSPDVRTYYLLGVLWGGEGDWEKSTEYLTSASELEPDNVDVLASLALSFSELGRKDDALATMKRARELAPGNVKVMRAVDTLVANGVL